MWEFEQYDSWSYNRFRISDISAKSSKRLTIRDVKAASLCLWTEHCSECGYPSCYETCDLYEPRFDLHCRTLKFGMKKSFAFSSIRPYSAMLVPKEWATLDAVISLPQIPFFLLRFIEGCNYIFADLAKKSSSLFSRFSPKKAPLRAFGILRDLFIDAISGFGGNKPEAFLLQVYNGSGNGCEISLKFTNFPAMKDSPFFQKLFLLDPGENEFVVLFSEIAKYLDLNKPIRAFLSCHGNREPLLFFGAADLVTFRKPYVPESQVQRKGMSREKIKCVVWDLDNTLWKGIVSERPEGIKITADVIDLLKTLDKRGIVHSIASKNNYEDAMAILERHGIEDYFVYPQINWKPKSEGIGRIVKELSIGIDTIAFIDDSEFELKEVNSQLPEVTTINSEDMASIADNPRFSGSTSSDSSKRRYFYKAEESRQHVHKAFSGSYEDFLLSCHMTITAQYPCEEDIERLHELVQRTNQLNFTGNRYTREDLLNLIHSPELDCLLVACNDDFGDYGAVGFCIIERGDNEVTVKELAISCRVLGKRVEQMFFKNMMQIYKKQGKNTLWLVYRKTRKNIPAMRVIEDMGFALFSEEGDQSLFRIEMASYVDLVDTADVTISMA